MVVGLVKTFYYCFIIVFNTYVKKEKTKSMCIILLNNTRETHYYFSSRIHGGVVGGDESDRRSATNHRANRPDQGIQTSLRDSFGCASAVRSYLVQSIVPNIFFISVERLAKSHLWLYSAHVKIMASRAFKTTSSTAPLGILAVSCFVYGTPHASTEACTSL